MARINLLPWRAELRKQRQKDFVAAILLGIVVTVALFLVVRSHISGKIDYQTRRNQFLESEIATLDQKIKEILELETKKKHLLARMDVIQQLQMSRPEAVHLIDELARTVPDGVYLTDMTQTDKTLTINGFAQSNARVSAYMRNLDASPWLKDPVLTIIESKNEAKESRKERTNKFTLQVKQKSEKPDEKPKGAS
jgi:type IV pilus assembly protein PilN